MIVIPKNASAPLLALVLCMTMPGRVAAAENPYDVLGKVLMPIANVFAPATQGEAAHHALVLDAHPTGASRLPPELQGKVIHVALMTPDSVLVQAPIGGAFLTVCRQGDSFWATPGSTIQGLLDQLPAKASGDKSKKHKAEAAKILGPLTLPFPQKELVFLPVLFQASDAGEENVAGVPCRILEVQFMPQVAKSLHAEDWIAQLWVSANYALVKIALTGPKWEGTVVIDKLDFPAELPEATFQPQGADVLRLTAGQFVELMGRIGRK